MTRLPPAVAMAAAAAVAALGRRLVSPSAGLASGLVFAILPPASVWMLLAERRWLRSSPGITAPRVFRQLRRAPSASIQS